MRFFGLFGLDCHRNIRYHRKGVELFWIVYRLNCFCWSVVFSLDIIHYSQNRSWWKARTFYQTFKLSWKRLNDINRLLLSNFFLDWLDCGILKKTWAICNVLSTVLLNSADLHSTQVEQSTSADRSWVRLVLYLHAIVKYFRNVNWIIFKPKFTTKTPFQPNLRKEY